MPATSTLIAVTLLQAAAEPEAGEYQDSQPGSGIVFLFLFNQRFFFPSYIQG